MTDNGEEGSAVLEALRAARRKLTPDQVCAATGLAPAVVDRALQALLMRKLVVCDSFAPPGRGDQTARWIGSAKQPLWAASYDEEDE